MYTRRKWALDVKWHAKGTCDAQHNPTKGVPARSSSPPKVAKYVNRWESSQNISVVFDNVEDADTSNQKKPKQHNWRKQPPNLIRPVVLHAKQANQYDNSHYYNYICNYRKPRT